MLWGSVCPVGLGVPIHIMWMGTSMCLSGVLHACVGQYIPFWSSMILFGALCAPLELRMHVQGLHIWGCVCLFGVVHACMGLCSLGAVHAQLGFVCACQGCACLSRVVCSILVLYMPVQGCECLSRIVYVYMGLYMPVCFCVFQSWVVGACTVMCMFHLGLCTHIWSTCP